MTDKRFKQFMYMLFMALIFFAASMMVIAISNLEMHPITYDPNSRYPSSWKEFTIKPESVTIEFHEMMTIERVSDMGLYIIK